MKKVDVRQFPIPRRCKSYFNTEITKSVYLLTVGDLSGTLALSCIFARSGFDAIASTHIVTALNAITNVTKKARLCFALLCCKVDELSPAEKNEQNVEKKIGLSGDRLAANRSANSSMVDKTYDSPYDDDWPNK